MRSPGTAPRAASPRNRRCRRSSVDRRAGVQPDLGVGQVIVVDQDQVSAALAGQLGDLGAPARDVGLHPPPPDQPVAGAVVQADRDPVRSAAPGGSAGRLLDDGERAEAVLAVAAVIGPQRVGPGGLQPLLRPGRQVPARRPPPARASRSSSVVLPAGMLGEVARDPGQEVVPAHVGDELLEHGRALGVGDPVEVDLTVSMSGDVAGDRVRRRQLVLAVRPRLLAGRRWSRPRPPGCLGLRTGRPPRWRTTR